MNDAKARRRWPRAFWILAGILACAAGAAVLWSRIWRDSSSEPTATVLDGAGTVSLDAGTVTRIEAFCGDCHVLPRPDSFPRWAWHSEVILGFAMYARSGRQDLQPPTIEATVAYYRQPPPEQLDFPQAPPAPHKLAVAFDIERLKIDETGGVKPAVAHLNWLRLQPQSAPELVVSDMRRGTVMAVTPGQPGAQPRTLATLRHPCHVESCDLDGDGTTDLVAADLGSIAAIDHLRGRVVWLRSSGAGNAYEPVVLAADIGRVDDVRPGDFDNDGDVDLVVAVFGLDRTGDTRLLWNVASRGEVPRFEPEIIDPRPGPIHVPPCDFDGDGFLDFASLISQECEQVAVFINQRGSAGTHGVVPHAIVVGRPRFDFWFQRHPTDRPGPGRRCRCAVHERRCVRQQLCEPAARCAVAGEPGPTEVRLSPARGPGGLCVASAGDLDLDGDLDIIATAWLPSQVQPANVYDHSRASILCLEQTAPGQFVRHVLEQDATVHAAMHLADFDADGDLDFAVGYHSFDAAPASTQWVDIWWNQTRGKSGATRP